MGGAREERVRYWTYTEIEVLPVLFHGQKLKKYGLNAEQGLLGLR